MHGKFASTHTTNFVVADADLAYGRMPRNPSDTSQPIILSRLAEDFIGYSSGTGVYRVPKVFSLALP